ncbi:MAG: hypothetical protein AABX99_02485 [Nanoarchaeota archaeon]
MSKEEFDRRYNEIVSAPPEAEVSNRAMIWFGIVGWSLVAAMIGIGIWGMSSKVEEQKFERTHNEVVHKYADQNRDRVISSREQEDLTYEILKENDMIIRPDEPSHLNVHIKNFPRVEYQSGEEVSVKDLTRVFEKYNQD